MRLSFTVVDASSGDSADVLLDAEPQTTIRDLAVELAALLQGSPPSTGANVLRLASRGSSSPGAPVLYVAGRPLKPDTPLAGSLVREGCLVSLDGPDGCLLPEPAGLREVRVVSGPNAGLVHRLGVGTSTIGSAPSSDVRIDSPAMPPTALTVEIAVSGECTVRLSEGVNGLLEGEAVEGSAAWKPHALLGVGGALLELAQVSPPDAALSPSEDGAGLDYNRPPRLLPPPRETVFKLPAPPRENDRRPLPIAMAVLPLVGGVTIALLTERYYYLLLALLSPLALIANYFSDKRFGRKSYRKQLAEYRERKARIEGDARAALLLERDARRADCPDPAALMLTAVGPRSRLWERRRHDADHLLLRFGTADLRSEVVLEDPELDEHKRKVRWQAKDVPVAVPLTSRGVVGIAGRPEVARRLGAWVVGQAAVLHSPADVQVYVVGDLDSRVEWEWVRWLPHSRPAEGQDTYALLGFERETTAQRLAELASIVAARTRALREASAQTIVVRQPDILVVLDGARRLRSMPGVIAVLRDGPAVGVYTVCLDADERLLPEECQAVVTERARGVRVAQMRTDVVDEVRPDLVTQAWCERVSRALSPVRDVSGEEEDSTLPDSSRLLDVVGLEPPAAEAIAARWVAGGRSTTAVIGEAATGEFAIDLRRDGPHGLVAGTTGSGKSELLQTLVASLAVANKPDAMTFVLVDYKGGAAFKDCVLLPHTVGMVTDLDTHLVERALQSLGAELRRREHILAGAGAKDIEDYTDLLRSTPSLEPMPRLLIVIDEFASMARDLPDFVTGLVNIAQRGRSLGIHLILATQRPSGVVSPEIRANTNLRIALRVTDAAESSDVIEAPDAARISKGTPGRAYVRLGHSSLVAFQAGRVGGRRPGAVSTSARPWLVELDAGKLGLPAPSKPVQRADDDDITDLKVLVDAIRGANDLLSLPPQHSPWLPALTETVLLDELPAAPPSKGGLPAVAYALEDLPAEQDRRASVLAFAEFGHMFIAGSPRSGRSQLLRTMAGAVARTISSADVHIYGIDCGNGALLPVAELPHCGAVVTRTQTERATRLITRLGAEVGRRQEVLAENGFADLEEQRAAVAPNDRMPHILVLLDRWEGFTTTLGEHDGGKLQEEMMLVLREGASVGVHLVIAGDRTLLSGRLSTMTEEKLAFRLADRTDFSLIGLNPRKMPEELPAGRAFRSESGIELHVALLDADNSGAGQAAALAEIGAKCKVRDAEVPRGARPFRVDVLPSRLDFGTAWKVRDEIGKPMWPLVGVGGDELTAYGPDLADGVSTFVVAGPPKSGRSTVLMAMARTTIRAGGNVVLVTPRQSLLRDMDGEPGVLKLFSGEDLPPDELSAVLDSSDAPTLVLIDDAEILRDTEAADVLRQIIRSGSDNGRGLVLAGNAEDVCSGFTGWQIEVKKGRRGALLSPQGFSDGDLIGVRVPRSLLGQPVAPGRALVHLGDGELVTVQVPVG